MYRNLKKKHTFRKNLLEIKLHLFFQVSKIIIIKSLIIITKILPISYFMYKTHPKNGKANTTCVCDCSTPYIVV